MTANNDDIIDMILPMLENRIKGSIILVIRSEEFDVFEIKTDSQIAIRPSAVKIYLSGGMRTPLALCNSFLSFLSNSDGLKLKRLQA